MKYTTSKNRVNGSNIRLNPWTRREDKLIIAHTDAFGYKRWAECAVAINRAFHAGKFVRSARQVREHWKNFLNPGLSRTPWTYEEETVLLQAHRCLGNRWASIQTLIPHRNENQIKNHWKSISRVKEDAENSQFTNTIFTKSQTEQESLGRSPGCEDSGILEDWNWDKFNVDDFISLPEIN